MFHCLTFTHSLNYNGNYSLYMLNMHTLPYFKYPYCCARSFHFSGLSSLIIIELCAYVIVEWKDLPFTPIYFFNSSFILLCFLTSVYSSCRFSPPPRPFPFNFSLKEAKLIKVGERVLNRNLDSEIFKFIYENPPFNCGWPHTKEKSILNHKRQG